MKHVIQKNYSYIQKCIFSRKLDTKIVCVTKYTEDVNLIHLYDLGQRDFGENRVANLVDKSGRLARRCPDIRWHFIGNLQSNKLESLFQVENFVAIHSVDRPSLLRKILTKCPEQVHLDLYLQIKTSDEEEKSGFTDYSEICECIDLLSARVNLKSNNLHLKGLMTMAPIRSSDYANMAKKSFNELAVLKARLSEQYPAASLELNMGMSKDFLIALDFGSSLLRVGTFLFQENGDLNDL